MEQLQNDLTGRFSSQPVFLKFGVFADWNIRSWSQMNSSTTQMQSFVKILEENNPNNLFLT